MFFGRISVANLAVNNDRVSMSSEGILGAVKLEKDLAADLSALRDAVRFDLSVDLCFTVRLTRGVKF